MEEEIIIYGVTWCGDCHRAHRFFQKHNIPYKFINIDKDKQAEKYVLTVNRGMRSVPTILFPDGSILVEPSETLLNKKIFP